MTSIMNQVTCSLCNMKIDELKWKEHLVSTNHLQFCKENKNKIAIKFFEMIFNSCPKKNKIYNLKIGKIHDFWQLYFSTKLPKEKFYILCSDSIDNSELEVSLSPDFQNFIGNVTPDIGETYFNLIDKKIFCKIYSIEIKKSLLYDHINSNEHKEIEDYFIRKCMTYCDLCCKEIRNDDWRENVISEKHLESEEKKYCAICNLKSNYYNKYNDYNHGKEGRNLGDKNNIDYNHLSSDLHMKNEERLDFYTFISYN